MSIVTLSTADLAMRTHLRNTSYSASVKLSLNNISLGTVGDGHYTPSTSNLLAPDSSNTGKSIGEVLRRPGGDTPSNNVFRKLAIKVIKPLKLTLSIPSQTSAYVTSDVIPGTSSTYSFTNVADASTEDKWLYLNAINYYNYSYIEFSVANITYNYHAEWWDSTPGHTAAKITNGSYMTLNSTQWTTYSVITLQQLPN